MRTLVSMLLLAGVLAGAAVPAHAADCKVTGWTEGYNGSPIFTCSGSKS